MATQSLNNTLADESINTVREQAAEWIVLLDTAENAEHYDRVKNECEHWQNDNPQHQRVFIQMQQMYSAFDDKRSQHRQHLGILGTFILGAFILMQLPWNVWTADHRTSVAEIRDVTLPDGSVVVLNNNTAINVNYTERHRIINLERGELMVTVEKDARPFSVKTTTGEATALGTIYQVKQEDDASIVTVQESSVRVSPLNNSENAITLNAGQRVYFTATNIGPIQTVNTDVPDWTNRHLVFNDVPLVQVIDRLKRYRSGSLNISKPLLKRDLHFTGVLPTNNNDEALSLLADALDLNLKQFTPHLVWLSERNEK